MLNNNESYSQKIGVLWHWFSVVGVGLRIYVTRLPKSLRLRQASPPPLHSSLVTGYYDSDAYEVSARGITNSCGIATDRGSRSK